MEKCGKPVHFSLFRLLRAVRLGDKKAIQVILSAVPSDYLDEAKRILNLKPNLPHIFEIPIFMTLHEFRLTTETAIKSGARIAGVSLEKKEEKNRIAKSSNQIMGLVIEELIGEHIDFPIPESIRDVIELRNRSEISDFRNFIIPFLDAVLQGDEQSSILLRKQIRKCIKAFRRFPTTQSLPSWTEYASLTVSAVEIFAGLPFVGLGTGIVSFGLTKLAEKWKNKSSWLYLAKIKNF